MLTNWFSIACDSCMCVCIMRWHKHAEYLIFDTYCFIFQP